MLKREDEEEVTDNHHDHDLDYSVNDFQDHILRLEHRQEDQKRISWPKASIEKLKRIFTPKGGKWTKLTNSHDDNVINDNISEEEECLLLNTTNTNNAGRAISSQKQTITRHRMIARTVEIENNNEKLIDDQVPLIKL